ncbi:MAG: SDR family oxidoreductase [Caldilineaceae bacterium]|nr:SDR family oxidoreductase [Caldilineaceae bacterium]
MTESSPSLAGLRALVTAAGSGIGRAIAGTLHAHGAAVHICDLDAERLAAARAELPGLGTTQADVADPAQVDRLFGDVAAHLGGLDVLVNNAGIAGPTGPVESLDPAAWERTMAVNINSQFYCARRAVPLLKAAGGGAIVNLSSVAGLHGYPLRAPYAASKWAVIGFTKTLAMELGDDGIRVNAICPGPVEGPRIDAVIAARAEAKGESLEATRASYLRQNSLHTFIQAQEIADLVVFLCTPTGRKFSGQALALDGNTETLRS